MRDENECGQLWRIRPAMGSSIRARNEKKEGAGKKEEARNKQPPRVNKWARSWMITCDSAVFAPTYRYSVKGCLCESGKCIREKKNWQIETAGEQIRLANRNGRRIGLRSSCLISHGDVTPVAVRIVYLPYAICQSLLRIIMAS